MKRLLTFLLCLLALECGAQPFTASLTPVNIFQQLQPNRLCKIQGWSIGVSLSNNPVIWDIPAYPTDANGVLWLTNPVIANYAVTVTAPPQSTVIYFQITNALTNNIVITNFATNGIPTFSVASLSIQNVNSGSNFLSGSLSGGVMSLTNQYGTNGGSGSGITNGQTGVTLSGTFSNSTFYGNGAGLTNLNPGAFTNFGFNPSNEVAPTVTMTAYYINNSFTFGVPNTVIYLASIPGGYPNITNWTLVLSGDTLGDLNNGTFTIGKFTNSPPSLAYFDPNNNGAATNADTTGTLVISTNVPRITPIGLYLGEGGVYYTSSNGNDNATGTNYPFQSIAQAVAQTTNGIQTNTIFLRGVQNAIASTVILESNTSIIGDGIGSTVVPYPAAGSAFNFSGDNIYLSKMTLGQFQAGSLPLVLTKGTNIVVDGISFFGGQDGINADGNNIVNKVYATFKNSTFSGGYDLACLEGSGVGTNSYIQFQNMVFQITPIANNLMRGSILTSMNASYDHCTFNITNTYSQNTYGVYIGNNCAVRMTGCSFNMSNANYSYPSYNFCGVFLGTNSTLYVDSTFNTNDLYNAGGTVVYRNVSGSNIAASGTLTAGSTTTLSNQLIVTTGGASIESGGLQVGGVSTATNTFDFDAGIFVAGTAAAGTNYVTNTSWLHGETISDDYNAVTNIVLTVAAGNPDTGNTYPVIANIGVGFYDSGKGFSAGENGMFTNTTGLIYAAYTNGIFYQSPAIANLSGGVSRYTFTFTGTNNEVFVVRQLTGKWFGDNALIVNSGSNTVSIGFDTNGSYGDFNINFNGQNRFKLWANGTISMNLTNGNNGFTITPSGFNFGNGLGSTAGTLGTNGLITVGSAAALMGKAGTTNDATTLTNLNASQLLSGTVPLAVLPTNLATVSSNIYNGNGAGLTNIGAANVTGGPVTTNGWTNNTANGTLISGSVTNTGSNSVGTTLSVGSVGTAGNVTLNGVSSGTVYLLFNTQFRTMYVQNGNTLANSDTAISITPSTGNLYNAISQHGFTVLGSQANTGYAFTSGTLAQAVDTMLQRNSAGVLEIDSGTAGAYRDLNARNIGTYTTNYGMTNGVTNCVQTATSVSNTSGLDMNFNLTFASSVWVTFNSQSNAVATNSSLTETLIVPLRAKEFITNSGTITINGVY